MLYGSNHTGNLLSSSSIELKNTYMFPEKRLNVFSERRTCFGKSFSTNLPKDSLLEEKELLFSMGVFNFGKLFFNLCVKVSDFQNKNIENQLIKII